MSGLKRLYDRRWRGVRVVNLAALVLLLAAAVGVYAMKARAGQDTARLAEVNARIAVEQRRIRGLRAEVAALQRPERLEILASQYLGLQPPRAEREASLDTVADALRRPVATLPKTEAAPR